MTEQKYIRCCNCNDIYHVTSFDKAPEFVVVRGEEREVPVDDRRAFMRRHWGHKLEALKAIGEKQFQSGHAFDPMNAGLIEVTNGKDVFVLRSFRNRIDEPLSFEIVWRDSLDKEKR